MMKIKNKIIGIILKVLGIASYLRCIEQNIVTLKMLEATNIKNNDAKDVKYKKNNVVSVREQIKETLKLK